MHRGPTARLPIAVTIRHAELGLADGCRVLQHGREYRLKLPGEPEITFSTSEVAVCRSNDLVRSSVRWRNSFSNRVFSWR